MSDERLHPSEWLEAAQSLPVGAKAYVKHGCGEGNKLLVEHKEHGWAAWCYRCSQPGYVPHPRETVAERLARMTAVRQAEEALEADTRPPNPPVFDVSLWPDMYKRWLFKAGVGKRLIAKHGLYYHERSNRVVLPVLKDGKLVYWQARSEDKEAVAKYINPKVSQKPLYKVGQGPVLVLTEDILSAIKVGQVTAAWSLLGTSIPETHLVEIVQAGSPVAIWLDPDGPGVKAANKIKQLLGPMVPDVRVIVSDKDPKLHSRKEILGKLGLDPTPGT